MTELLAGQPQRDGEPVFDAPWQAKAFAMVVQLHEKGLFEWQEWADRLSANIKIHEVTGQVGNSGDYYGLWIKTLEEFVNEKLDK